MQNLVILLDPVCQFLHDPERIFSLAQDTQSWDCSCLLVVPFFMSMTKNVFL